jgi:COP9 signalosome complex subunit 1
MAPQDVAVYGALCALASFDRSDLKVPPFLYYLFPGVGFPSISMFHSMIEFIQSKVIDNVNFRNFLELVPEVREFVNDFYSRYDASVLSYSPIPIFKGC